MKRFEIGTIVDGRFAADTLGNDPELTTFETIAAAVAEIRSLAANAAKDDNHLSGCAVSEIETGSIVWNQPTHSPAVADYSYDINGVDDMTGKAVIVVNASNGERVAWALFTVDRKGNVECDASSDGCEENPFDDGGWPLPPAGLIAEARLALRKVKE